MSKPGLTITLIVRDELDNLRELLPVLTATADDVVVVDTGSSDGSADLARDLGARVVEFAWEDDFSKARNRALDEVQTSHVMWLDADDRITPEDLATVRREALARGRTGLMLRLVNESPIPNRVSTCHQLRVFPARREHRFRGRVHEQVQGALAATGTPIVPLDVTVRHLGYADDGEVARKSGRNLELGRREWADGNHGIASAYHYVKAAALCGEHEEAARIARGVVENPPDDSQEDILQNLRVTLGKAEWNLGRPLQAERCYRDAVRAVPDDPLARLHLGELLRLGGRTEEALEHLQVARVSPFHGTRVPMPVAGVRRAIRSELGRALEVVMRLGEAAEVYREALRELPDDAELQRRLARVLLSLGEIDEAGRVLACVRAPESANASFVLLRAAVAFEKGRDDEAEVLYGSLARSLPRSPIVPLRLGLMALRTGRAAHAQPLLNTALAGFDAQLRHRGPDPVVLTRLGECYQGLSETRAARMAYEEALRAAPGFPEAERALARLAPPGGADGPPEKTAARE